ncbi:uncharacterized protein LOC131932115 [Physella acuta]|uniref:uncharacterized protein LOC131932115 n=1 Tax=Physella acuta TaxID=109671 RepID=UPI0027DB6813|nr:uncharacterized protein LOC131932115 [Physella acuta]
MENQAQPSNIKQQAVHEIEAFSNRAFVEKEEAITRGFFMKCDKKDQHRKYIPFTDFIDSDLPRKYRDSDIVGTVKALGDLVVRLEVIKGQITELGTGRVKFSQVHYQNCHCVLCEQLPYIEKPFGTITIVTGTHVVGNSIDAQNTTCLLDFNNENERSFCVKLKGSRVKVYSDVTDRCEFYCFTYDIGLCINLREKVYSYNNLNANLNRKYSSNPNANLAIIVAHPHGWCKQVSIGQLLDVHTKPSFKPNIKLTQYLYNTTTCSGSSGAPLFFLGREKVWTNHPHWGYDEAAQSSFSAYEIEDVTSNFLSLIKAIKERPNNKTYELINWGQQRPSIKWEDEN